MCESRNIEVMSRPKSDPIERFWSKVNKTDNCWLWTGAVSDSGYAKFSVDRRMVHAHRFALGDPPTGHRWSRLCGDRRCVNPDHFTAVAVDADSRFWAKVNKTDTCWLWTGSIDASGYGRFRCDGRWIGAHRYLRGDAPAGMQWDHLCRVRHCVRPDHLEPVTPRENTQRGARGRLRTHCINRHRWIPENQVRRSDGGLDCKLCRAARAAAKCPEENRARARQYYYANREKRLAYQREYSQRKRAERTGISHQV